MPRVGPRRELVALRMLPAAAANLNEQAAEEGLYDERGRPNRSELIRIMLAFAKRNMPKGWRPPA